MDDVHEKKVNVGRCIEWNGQAQNFIPQTKTSFFSLYRVCVCVRIIHNNLPPSFESASAYRLACRSIYIKRQVCVPVSI